LEPDPLLPWLLAIKLGLYAFTLLGAGLSLHAALGIIEDDARRGALKGAALAALAALILATARLLVVNAQLGGGPASAFDTTTLPWAWQAFGWSTSMVIAGAAGILAGWRLRITWLAAIGAVFLAASFAFTGHSEALEDPGFAPPAVAVHVTIAAVWVVAPLTLWPRKTIDDPTLVARLSRFSTIAAWAVPVLFLLGAWLASSLAGGIPALISQPYGQLLVAKLSVALIALAMGALNKFRLTRAIANHEADGRKALQRTLLVELLIFVIALLLVAIATTIVGPADMP
jgi:putative copper export protein